MKRPAVCFCLKKYLHSHRSYSNVYISILQYFHNHYFDFFFDSLSFGIVMLVATPTGLTFIKKMVKQNWKTSREHSKYSDPVGFATKFWCPKTTHMYSSNQRHAILAWFCNKPQFLFETLGPSPIVCFVCLSLTEKKNIYSKNQNMFSFGKFCDRMGCKTFKLK